MDIQAVALIGLVLAVLVAGIRTHRHQWPGRPGWQYQRVFSVGFGGLLFLVAGLIGWDLKHSHGWFQGTKWVEAPIWWQVALGTGLVLLAMFWARRVPPRVAR
jgi:protein-S-isoprenylcysteine O-methyltransferase Ste14